MEEMDYIPGRNRRRRRKKNPVGWILLVLILVFAGGVLSGLKLAGSGWWERLLSGVLWSNVPEQIELPSYIEEELLTLNPYSRPGTKLTRVNDIIIHYVGNPDTTAAQNRSYFQGLAESGATHASSNLIVGMEGEVLLCVPLNEVAYCSNSRNNDSISIEFCHPDDSGEPTEATYGALVELTAWLCELYGLDEDDILRHYDVIGKACPRYFVAEEEAWEQFREQVGERLG